MKKPLNIVLLALFMLSASNIALSLDPKKALRQYIHESWNTSNGLPQNSCSAIYQGPDGYMWFGTQEGVARFDGSKFTVFDRSSTPEIVNNDIPYIFGSPDGSIWFVALSFLDVTRYKDGKFVHYGKKDGFIASPGNSGGVDSSGALWVCTFHGILKFETDHFVTLTRKDGLPCDSVYGFYTDPHHRVWLRTFKGLSEYENGRFVNYGKQDGLLSDTIYAARQDHNGNLWLGTPHGLNLLSKGKFTSFYQEGRAPQRGSLLHF